MTDQELKTLSYSYAELLELLSYMNEENMGKLPNQLVSLFKSYADPEYVSHIDPDKTLLEQDLKPDTISLLTLLTLNYWCETEEQKSAIKDILDENERIYQEELKAKYDPSKMFENPQTTAENAKIDGKISTENSQSVDNNLLPVDYSSFPWYKKLAHTIKNFIYKLFKKQ